MDRLSLENTRNLEYVENTKASLKSAAETKLFEKADLTEIGRRFRRPPELETQLRTEHFCKMFCEWVEGKDRCSKDWLIELAKVANDKDMTEFKKKWGCVEERKNSFQGHSVYGAFNGKD
jgi:hypothetical protein